MDAGEGKFFAPMPQALYLYEALKMKITTRFENVEIRIQKSQIAFAAGKNFAFVWLPLHKMKNRPDVYIILTLGLDYQLQNARVVQSTEPYPKRWTHHIIIADSVDIDEEIMGWLQQAYTFAQSKK